MKLPSTTDGLEEWAKAHGSYPESATIREQKPGLKGGMRSTVVTGKNPWTKKTPQSIEDVWLKLIC